MQKYRALFPGGRNPEGGFGMFQNLSIKWRLLGIALIGPVIVSCVM